MKEIMEEVKLQDEPGYEEVAEMYFSVKNINVETGEIDENRTNLTVRELIRPLVETATPDQMMMLEKASKKYDHSGLLSYDHSTLLAHVRFELGN